MIEWLFLAASLHLLLSSGASKGDYVGGLPPEMILLRTDVWHGVDTLLVFTAGVEATLDIQRVNTSHVLVICPWYKRHRGLIFEASWVVSERSDQETAWVEALALLGRKVLSRWMQQVWPMSGQW